MEELYNTTIFSCQIRTKSGMTVIRPKTPIKTMKEAKKWCEDNFISDHQAVIEQKTRYVFEQNNQPK